MHNFLRGFSKAAAAATTKQDGADEMSDAKKSLLAGAAATGGVAAYQGSKAAIRDAVAYRNAPKAKTIKELKSHLKPGDIIFTRKAKSPNFSSLPITEKDVMQAALGSPEYHAALYTPKKHVFHAWAGHMPVANHEFKMHQGFSPNEAITVYRPTAATSSERRSALKQNKRLFGKQYKRVSELVADGAKGLLAPELSSKACHKVNGRIVCNEVVTSAYPKQFKRRSATIEDMKSTKGMKLIATYGNKPSLREHVTSKVVYPLMRNLRLAPAAAALAYGGFKAKKYLDEKRDS